jgi:hypothetical protein
VTNVCASSLLSTIATWSSLVPGPMSGQEGTEHIADQAESGGERRIADVRGERVVDRFVFALQGTT